jgi:light-regulated signal transduction histidine kinase (bacteriophytochrome)
MLDTVIASAANGYAHLRSPRMIQGFGVMLVLHPRTLRVVAASENVQAELGLAHAQVLGAAFSDMLDAAAAREIQSAAGDDEPVFQNPIPATIGGRRFDIILHAQAGLLIAELEPLAPGAATRDDLDRLGEAAIEGMIVPGDLEALMQAAPTAIRAVTQFDRVMLYRFDEAYRGQVMAEARRSSVDGFLGLFFPESDIGPAGRELYTQNFCRYIPHIAAKAVPLKPAENPLSGRPIDMSRAVLRGVAPCHTEYLTNMGVAASMSFSIVSEGRLWGLLACHHYQVVQLSYTQRMVCEQIAMLFTARLAELANPESVQVEMQQVRTQVLATSPLLRTDPIGQVWTADDEKAVLHLVNADGVAIYMNGRVGQIGTCPDLTPLHTYLKADPEGFDRLIHVYDDRGLFHTNRASTGTPFGAEMGEYGSGMMIIPLARTRGSYAIWFRPEQVLKASWAGNPSLASNGDPDGPASPRKSFATWKEDIRDRAAPWAELEISNAIALRDAALARHN